MTSATLPPIGIGTYDLDPAPCRRSVRTALEAGYRHVDTAEMYENEVAVGEALYSVRARLFVGSLRGSALQGWVGICSVEVPIGLGNSASSIGPMNGAPCRPIDSSNHRSSVPTVPTRH